MTCRGYARRYFIVTLVLAFGLLGLAGRVEAVPVSDFTGNTFVDSGVSGGVSGTINYAVFTSADFSADAAGILLSFVPGSGSGALDLNGTVVYAFQVANNGSDPFGGPIGGLNVSIPGVAPTSWGYFENSVFVDTSNGGANVDAANNLGADESKPSGGSIPRTGVTSVGFAALAAAVNPAAVLMNAGFDVTNWLVSPEVLAGQTSSLLVYTVGELPTFQLATVFDGGGTPASGPVPTPLEGLSVGLSVTAPEPGTLLLLVSGLLGLVACRRKRAEDSEER